MHVVAMAGGVQAGAGPGRVKAAAVLGPARPGSYIRIIRLSQMMYMIPRRRAIACGVPSAAGASSQATNASAISFSAGTRTERIQSTARPSKCSLVLEVQVRGM